ncbi:FecR domain-containing protein [Halosquirtibacter laminarini]|uniref:FecR domain-containing protein n=1 Tax=Halosquirtibacter laminarini TaxID=3374600 RepID=A0AC61NR88_9BACT|nr:FecR domain-containing protein [Prolixibacteraceae bacterium]
MKNNYYILKAKSILGTLTEKEQKILSQLDQEDCSRLEDRLVAMKKGKSNSKKVEQLVMNKISSKGNRSLLSVWFVAASIVVLLGIWQTLLMLNGTTVCRTYSNKGDSPKSLVLSDRTEVTLNKGAVLDILSDFSGVRKVALRGEAIFHVSHDEKRPFIVKGDLGSVKVLGTTFVVDNTSDELKTTLIEGSVAFQTNVGEVILKPNQQAVFSDSQQKINVVSVRGDLSTSWSDGKICFQNVSLSSVLARIAKEKDVKIYIKSREKALMKVSGEFEVKSSLESMLYALTKVTKSTYKKDGDSYVIE